EQIDRAIVAVLVQKPDLEMCRIDGRIDRIEAGFQAGSIGRAVTGGSELGGRRRLRGIAFLAAFSTCLGIVASRIAGAIPGGTGIAVETEQAQGGRAVIMQLLPAADARREKAREEIDAILVGEIRGPGIEPVFQRADAQLVVTEDNAAGRGDAACL